jgi:hypothetical protein
MKARRPLLAISRSRCHTANEGRAWSCRERFNPIPRDLQRSEAGSRERRLTDDDARRRCEREQTDLDENDRHQDFDEGKTGRRRATTQ